MPEIKEHPSDPENTKADFIQTAIWHGSLAVADSLLASQPELASLDIFTASILGNARLVRDFLSADPSNATITAAPYGGNALVYLCMSKYLRLKKEKSDDFLDAAKALLDAGADPNSGFWTTGSNPEFETALYGAAGIAHHEGLTKLLLEYGADPNDGEAVYHSPETHENAAMIALVETGKVSAEYLVLMLIRKHDWHDYDGVKYLLGYGVDPNERWAATSPFHHALMRNNHIDIISLLLDHGASSSIICNDLTVEARAAREGRSDVLAELRERGIPDALQGVDKLIEACAIGNNGLAKNILQRDPQLLDEMIAMGGNLLAKFSGTGNLEGVRQLLEVGIQVDAPLREGDGYFGIPKGSLAIHVAAWRGRHQTVQLLVDRGSPIDQPDQNGRTPLQLAVKACVDSYWMDRRSPESVAILLKAGAEPHSISLPTGYELLDEEIRKYY